MTTNEPEIKIADIELTLVSKRQGKVTCTITNNLSVDISRLELNKVVIDGREARITRAVTIKNLAPNEPTRVSADVTLAAPLITIYDTKGVDISKHETELAFDMPHRFTKSDYESLPDWVEHDKK